MNSCLTCKHVLVNEKELITTRLMPNRELEINCTKYYKRAIGTYQALHEKTRELICYEK